MVAAALQMPQVQWLRGPKFDAAFLVGTVFAAALAGAFAGIGAQWFALVLVLDLWLLGYPHVIATYTRLSFDTQSFRNHRFLVLGLPPVLFLATLGVALTIGPWILLSIYFYWQWFHYSRQSYGVEQIYRKKALGAAAAPDRLSKWAFYAVPVWGILRRSHQDPGMFLNFPLMTLPVPGAVVDLVAWAAIALLTVWALRTLRDLVAGRSALLHVLYMASHFWIFSVGYLLIEDINVGWLVINVWHNAQYLLIVWIYQNRRFGEQVDPQHRFLSSLSLRKHVAAFFGVCLVLSFAIYQGIHWLGGFEAALAIPLVFLVSQTLNFHHYIADGIIWKIRKDKIQSRLGLADAATAETPVA